MLLVVLAAIAAVTGFAMWRLLAAHEPAPAPIRLIEQPIDRPPHGFDSWFAWEAVQFTEVPAAFWMDPFRNDYTPTLAEEREAQAKVARVFGLELPQPVERPDITTGNGGVYYRLAGSALAQITQSQSTRGLLSAYPPLSASDYQRYSLQSIP